MLCYISILVHSRRTTTDEIETLPPYEISILAHSRRATSVFIATIKDTSISILSHSRGATTRAGLCKVCAAVSIHAPTRGATISLPHIVAVFTVSIHAPTRGATVAPHISGGSHRVSIHAPTRGATAESASLASKANVSIHAPTRGATWTVTIFMYCVTRFNPRPHAGGDKQTCRYSKHYQCFNPRPHAGGDIQRGFDTMRLEIVSIHAPTRGATWLTSLMHPCGIVSIHAPTRGATAKNTYFPLNTTHNFSNITKLQRLPLSSHSTFPLLCHILQVRTSRANHVRFPLAPSYTIRTPSAS